MIAAAGVAWGTIPWFVRSIEPIPLAVGFLDAPLNVAPVTTVFWRVTLAAISMAAISMARRRFRTLFQVDRRTFGLLALNGVLLAVHWVLFFSALVLTDVAVAELLTYTGPVYVAALTPLVLGERFDSRVVLPIAVAVAGTALVLGPDLSFAGASAAPLGAGAALLAALGYAVLMLNTKRLLGAVRISAVMFWESLVASAVLLPGALLLPPPASSAEWASLGVLGVVHSVLVVFVFMAGLRRVRADHAAVLTYAEPVSAVLFASLFLGEPLAVTTVLGGAVVVAGGVMVARLTPTTGVEAPAAELMETERPPDREA
jgi:drug/metabolite transporter (DMT)-like permease